MESRRDRFEERGRPAVGKGRREDVPEEETMTVLGRTRDMEAPTAHAGVFARAPEDASDGENAVEPVATASASTVHQAALHTHRMSTGHRASGFEPQWNTFHVCGRPVQVFQWSNKIPSVISGVSNDTPMR